jgi:hypothetical protein
MTFQFTKKMAYLGRIFLPNKIFNFKRMNTKGSRKF